MSNEQASTATLLTEEQIEEKVTEARAKHPLARFAHVHTIMGTAVFRSAKRGEWKQHMAMLGAKQIQEGLEYIARATVVYPDAVTFDTWLDNAPGIAQTVAKPIDLLAGMEGGPGKG
jgi:hypothetical protein